MNGRTRADSLYSGSNQSKFHTLTKTPSDRMKNSHKTRSLNTSYTIPRKTRLLTFKADYASTITGLMNEQVTPDRRHLNYVTSQTLSPIRHYRAGRNTLQMGHTLHLGTNFSKWAMRSIRSIYHMKGYSLL